MNAATGRGLGKVILLGEHAVVYGHPAFAGAIDRGVRCRALPSARAGLELRVPAWDARVVADPGDEGLAGACAAVASAVGAGELAATLTCEADIPAGAGLGSSAAISVALARALAAAAGRPLGSPEDVERAAGAGEAVIHRRPSGVDVALAARGGLGLYRRDAGLQPVPAAPIPLAVALSAEPRRTGEMVDLVADTRHRDASADRRLSRLGEAALEGAKAARNRDADALGRLLSAAHDDLAALGVSTPALDELVADAMAAGAKGAKLTGAGGGGAVIALAPGREEVIAARWRDRGLRTLVCRVGAATGGEGAR